MNIEPIILHIDLGTESVSSWLKRNQYIIFSELIRYSEILLKNKLNFVQAILVSNLNDNIVFIIKKENVKLTLDKAMDFFIDIEEYEKCAEIRDLYILIENLKNETNDTKTRKSNQRGLKSN